MRICACMHACSLMLSRARRASPQPCLLTSTRPFNGTKHPSCHRHHLLPRAWLPGPSIPICCPRLGSRALAPSFTPTQSAAQLLSMITSKPSCSLAPISSPAALSSIPLLQVTWYLAVTQRWHTTTCPSRGCGCKLNHPSTLRASPFKGSRTRAATFSTPTSLFQAAAKRLASSPQ